MRLLSSVCLLSILTGCAGQQMQQKLHARKVVKRAQRKPVKVVRHKRQVISQTFSSVKKKKINVRPRVKKTPERTISSLSDGLLDLKDDLQLEYHPKLFKFWVKYFSNKKNRKNKARFIRHMKNGEKYRSLITEVFKKHGLPADLFYVGLIESGFNTHIRSHADAVGPWQFIKGTATRYGLRVDRYVDERRNIHKATEAAAGYFKDLYNIFGSWELALCAYNAGEYRIINAIRKGNTRDYRKLVEKKLIPKETVYYVPKVAAARYLSKHRRKYTLPVKFQSGYFYKSAERKEVKKSFSLSRLSKDLGVPHKTMKRLNPDYKGNWIRVGRKGQSVVIPKSARARFTSLNIAKKNVRRYALRGNTGSKRTPKSKRVYKVRRGDNLYSISKKYGVSISKLKSFNRIKGSRIKYGQRLKIPSATKKSYIVRNGDNLTHIARKFNTSISTITAYNKIRGNRIYKGQRIYLP